MESRFVWVGFSLVIALILGCTPHAYDDIKAADAATRKGETDEAIRLYTSAIASGHLNTKAQIYAFYYRGVAWHTKHDYDHAIADYSEVIRLSPQFASGFARRGSAWYAEHDYDRAIADYNEAIRLLAEPAAALPQDAARSIGERGDVWYAKHDYDRAIADYDEVIRLSPQHAGEALDHRGNAWRAKNDRDRAMADFDEAIRLNPKDAYAHGARGMAQFNLGRFPAAATELANSQQLQASAYIAVWLYLARARAGMADAKAELEVQSKSLNSDWPRPVISLYLGELDHDGVLARALDKDAEKQKDQVCEANFFIGEWYLLQGDKETANPSFRRAQSDCPEGSVELEATMAELKRMAP